MLEPEDCGRTEWSYVKLVKIKGEFVCHHHENEDELFRVVKGYLRIRLRDRDVSFNPGEVFIVPKGVEHMPVAEEETHILLLEPKSTLNSGNDLGERSVAELQKI